ncbi:hypothetical protein [Tichowtungia aerotolerans]|uniref:Uncharacterized protein n=1 Tax=Tichowtungia aerotolerans TaxID=2697043 RepID=A0A6P1M5Z7_9BACT|nr:hypothetical protein [Tichowtungia aerotolerans]QHI68423.1 hypothetical protein GT409_02780 [Tichowtungia aerotolerans]
MSKLETLSEFITPGRVGAYIPTLSPEAATALARDTIPLCICFQHVFNSRLPESNEFKAYLKTLSEKELLNIDYIRVDGLEIKLARRKSDLQRGLDSLWKKTKKPNCPNHDGVSFYQSILSKKFGKGKSRKPYSLLQRYVFRQFADLFEKHAEMAPKTGSASCFLSYLELCRDSMDGDLKNIRALAILYSP